LVLDRGAGDAEQEEDLVEEWVVHGCVCHLAKGRLRVEGDTKARGREHVDIVRTVAHCHGLVELDAIRPGELLEGLGLRVAVDNRADHSSRELALADLRGLGSGGVGAENSRPRLEYLSGHAGLYAG